MNRIIAITQREIVDKSSLEIRDSLDRRWLAFFKKCNITPLLLPNDLSLTKEILSKVKIDGIILTGGGDIKSCGGKDFAREEVEDFLIGLSIKKKIPLIAVCRGMQKIQDRFKVSLSKVPGHVIPKQKIVIDGRLREVNSFHNFGSTKNNSKEFEVFAIAKDGVIKGIRHKKHKITGIMWHPERFRKFRVEDIALFCEGSINGN